MMPILERIQRNRDVVFVDQRGTGDSRPLKCDPVPPDAPLSKQFDDTFYEHKAALLDEDDTFDIVVTGCKR